MNKITLLLSLGLLVFSFGANAGASNKPIAICPNLQELVAYKMSNLFVGECAQHNVKIDFKNAKNYLWKTLDEDGVATAGECNTQCAVLGALNKTGMSKCVEDMSNAFLEGALSSAKFNEKTCKDFQRRL